MNNDDLLKLEAAAIACSPQNLDSAESVIKANPDAYIECPICNGDGAASTENDYCNIDNLPVGVQFYGIGKEVGAAEDYFRAASPAAVLSLINRLRFAESKFTSDPLADLAAVMRHHGIIIWAKRETIGIFDKNKKILFSSEDLPHYGIEADDLISTERKNDPS